MKQNCIEAWQKFYNFTHDLLSKYLFIALLFVIIFHGYQLRSYKYEQTSNVALGGDAREFYEHALNRKSFYEAHLREPLLISMCQASLYVFGEYHSSLRQQSLWFSVLLIFLTYWVGSHYSSRFVGLTAAFLLAISPTMIDNSCRALRMEFYMCQIMLFVYVLFQSNLRENTTLILSCFLGTMMTLTRLSSLPILCMLFGYYWLARFSGYDRQQKLYLAGKILLSLLVIFITITPFLYNCWQKYEDPFYSVNLAAVFWRNQEFAGQPGFLTPQQVTQSPYAGPHITTAKYIFGMHSFFEVYQRYVGGYLSVFFVYFPLDSVFLTPISYLGLVAFLCCLFIGKYRYLNLVFLIVLFPYAFILMLDTIGHKGVDLRFAFCVYPIYTIFIAQGLQYILSQYRKNLQLP